MMNVPLPVLSFFLFCFFLSLFVFLSFFLSFLFFLSFFLSCSFFLSFLFIIGSCYKAMKCYCTKFGEVSIILHIHSIYDSCHTCIRTFRLPFLVVKEIQKYCTYITAYNDELTLHPFCWHEQVNVKEVWKVPWGVQCVCINACKCDLSVPYIRFVDMNK